MEGAVGPRPRRVAAVVLAAGSSARMGRNKLLLDLGGQALVRRAVRAGLDAGLDQVIVVLGHDEARVRSELDGLPCALVVNPDHAQGAGTSLRTGIRHAAAETDAVLIVLADMPFVTAEMIAALARRYRETGAPLVASHYGPVQAPPTLYDRSLFGELLTIPDESGGKDVVRRHRGEAQILAWPESALGDIDVPADYEAAQAGLRKR